MSINFWFCIRVNIEHIKKERIMICTSCPRRCGVDRLKSVGYCRMPSAPKVAKAYLHKWEEPCISGDKGSGTIFFSGCNLRCVYCQNYSISSECEGKEISISRLAEIFRELEEKGAENINLVSPSHYIDAIVQALEIYRPSIPIVYNSNGYDLLEGLEKIRDYIDVFLVDFKYFDSSLSESLSNAKDYPEVAKKAILRMREFQPREIYEGDKLKKGVIIRHLILPNHIDDSIKILEWIKENISNPTISLMGQYTPMYKANEYKDICRPLKPIEYKIVANKMIELGLEEGYFQDLTSATDCYTPVWDNEGV